MSLFANVATISDTLEALPTAQHYREILSAHGFIPLTKIFDGEHWVRSSRRVILAYKGDCPGEVRADDLHFARVRQIGDSWILDLE